MIAHPPHDTQGGRGVAGTPVRGARVDDAAARGVPVHDGAPHGRSMHAGLEPDCPVRPTACVTSGGATRALPEADGPLLDVARLRHIAVIRALPGLGDLLCTVPALRALRRGSPSARITLVGLPGAEWFVERFRWYVDDLLVLPSWPSIPEAVGTPSTTLAMLAGPLPPFGLALQLQGSGGPINGLGRALGARVVVGHERQAGRRGDTWLRRWPTTGHESERIHDLAVWAGFPFAGDHLEFPELPGDAAAADAFLGPCTDRLVVVHPGASRPDRRWSAEGFAAVADRLADGGATVVVTAGRAERSLAQELAARCRTSPRVAPPMPVGSLAALVRRAAALVVNDTGVAHLGVAVGTPTVVVGTTSDLDRWGPADRVRHRVVRTTGVLGLDVDDVAGAAEDVLRQGAGWTAPRAVSTPVTAS